MGWSEWGECVSEEDEDDEGLCQDKGRGRWRGNSTDSVEDAVDVERGVHRKRRVEDRVPYVASAVGLRALAREGKDALGRVGDVLLKVVCVVAPRGDRVELCEERLAVGCKALVVITDSSAERGEEGRT